jgi:hypothetical protein
MLVSASLCSWSTEVLGLLWMSGHFRRSTAFRPWPLKDLGRGFSLLRHAHISWMLGAPGSCLACLCFFNFCCACIVGVSVLVLVFLVSHAKVQVYLQFRQLYDYTGRLLNLSRFCRYLLYLCSFCSHFEHRASVKSFISLQFLNLRHSVGFLGRGIRPSKGRVVGIRDGY